MQFVLKLKEECSYHTKWTKKLLIILYSDDILIIAPSVTALQSIVYTCERQFNRFDLSVNVKKSSCMRVGPRHGAGSAEILCDDNTPLQWVDCIRYLGVVLVRSCKFKCSLENAKRSFFRSVNALFCKIGRSASEDLSLHLVNSNL